MNDREKEFNFMVEQIRNFITHCLGFQPDDMTGGEFNNRFIWKTDNSEFEIIAYYYYGCSCKTEQDYFDKKRSTNPRGFSPWVRRSIILA